MFKITIILFEIISFCYDNKSFPLALDLILTFPLYLSKFNSLLEVPIIIEIFLSKDFSGRIFLGLPGLPHNEKFKLFPPRFSRVLSPLMNGLGIVHKCDHTTKKGACTKYAHNFLDFMILLLLKFRLVCPRWNCKAMKMKYSVHNIWIPKISFVVKDDLNIRIKHYASI